jgi:hypothetical protein
MGGSPQSIEEAEMVGAGDGAVGVQLAEAANPVPRSGAFHWHGVDRHPAGLQITLLTVDFTIIGGIARLMLSSDIKTNQFI